MAFDLEKVSEVARRVVESSGLELVDVELRGGGKSRMVRIVIDRPGGVTHDDCANVSREVGVILDVEDAVPGAYTLEVSSPGLDRKLVKPSDYGKFVGSRVKLTMLLPVNGERHFDGRLVGFQDGWIELAPLSAKGKKKGVEGPAVEPVRLELKNVEKANLVPEF